MTASSSVDVAAGEPRTDPKPVVAVNNLRVHFQVKAGVVEAVDGVNFELLEGETLGLVGETGCGKSVTARSFLGLVPSPPALPPQGTIDYRHRNGGGVVDLLTLDSEAMGDIRGNHIAMIFQDPGKALNPALTVRDQLGEVFLIHRSADVLEGAGFGADDTGLGASLIRRAARLKSGIIERLLLALPPLRNRRNRLRASADRLIMEALADTQIPNPANILDRYPHELSGGMKQRVMIAQALACNPDVLIADEPTTALDVTVQARIIELISQLQRRHNTSVLYISHDLSLVRRVCDRIAVMYAGRIVEIGPADQLFARPKHPYTRGLLAAIPSLASRAGELEAIEGTVPELIDPEPGCRFADRCRHSTEMCLSAEPNLVDVDVGHAVSCFAYAPITGSDQTPPTVADPAPAAASPSPAPARATDDRTAS
ncbi:MAG: ABC transporter ATP-binding protein [Acidimicrobiia bacterium]|nr:ABC transporter ATP-binding protein [Acidimicrobiia bacterium]